MNDLLPVPPPLTRREALGAAAAAIAASTTFGTTLAAGPSRPVRVYFGTYTRGKSKGIYVADLHLNSGSLTEPRLAVEASNPDFLAIHPNQRFLYAVGGIAAGGGGVSAYSMDAASGRLTLMNQQPTGGAGPTHLVVDASGRNVLVANYSGGSTACLPIGADGSLKPVSAFIQHQGSSVNPARQTAPHAHGIYTDAANRFVFVPDLGLDKILIYRFDPAHGTLVPNDPPHASVAPGSGPRHFAFDPANRFGFVINEMLCTMTSFRYDRNTGRLTEVGTVSTLPAGVAVAPEFSTAEVFVHPNGRFVYGSNRGHDTLAVFRIAADGSLTLIQNAPARTKIPRGFGIDPTGQFLIAGGQNSDNAAVFRINPDTGLLNPTAQSVTVGAPVCVVFLKP